MGAVLKKDTSLKFVKAVAMADRSFGVIRSGSFTGQLVIKCVNHLYCVNSRTYWSNVTDDNDFDIEILPAGTELVIS